MEPQAQQEMEHSQAEYVKGVSNWNFDVAALKASAAAEPLPPVPEGGPSPGANMPLTATTILLTKCSPSNEGRRRQSFHARSVFVAHVLPHLLCHDGGAHATAADEGSPNGIAHPPAADTVEAGPPTSPPPPKRTSSEAAMAAKATPAGTKVRPQMLDLPSGSCGGRLQVASLHCVRWLCQAEVLSDAIAQKQGRFEVSTEEAPLDAAGRPMSAPNTPVMGRQAPFLCKRGGRLLPICLPLVLQLPHPQHITSLFIHRPLASMDSLDAAKEPVSRTLSQVQVSKSHLQQRRLVSWAPAWMPTVFVTRW